MTSPRSFNSGDTVSETMIPDPSLRSARLFEAIDESHRRGFARTMSSSACNSPGTIMRIDFPMARRRCNRTFVWPRDSTT